ncbi:MAG: hypothetical protein KID08_19045 [Pseudomonas putida]|nr:hypothetical protein [Pseudomonas putida]HEN8704492.1 hypothetical protein [Pseudomonas putida]
MLPSIRIDVAIIGAGTAGLYLHPRWKRKVTLSIVFSDPNEVSVGARPGELNQERISVGSASWCCRWWSPWWC